MKDRSGSKIVLATVGCLLLSASGIGQAIIAMLKLSTDGFSIWVAARFLASAALFVMAYWAAKSAD